jgi:hypothetical protein
MTQTNSTMTFKQQIWLDRAFVKMEKRGLVTLLKGDSRELYRRFLSQPIAYRQYIRRLEREDWA